MREEAKILGKTSGLVSVVSIPEKINGAVPGVLIMNAGLVHHVGPNRWSVRLARRLAEAGHVCVRFDHGGLGDSDPRRDALPGDKAVVTELREVMEYLTTNYNINTFILIGLCSGASTAFLVAKEDARVEAAILVNPPAAGEDQATTQTVLNESWANRYLTISLVDPNAWWRAVTGRIQYRRMFRVLGKKIFQRLRPSQEVDGKIKTAAEMFKEITGRGTRLMLLFSARDQGMPLLLKMLEDPGLKEAKEKGLLRTVTIRGTDHTFGLQCSQEELIGEVEEFLTR